MIRPPPTSPLFPYTTLFRSDQAAHDVGQVDEDVRLRIGVPRGVGGIEDPGPTRSEEHTSELQSLRHLVCRLLLEKKNKNEGERLTGMKQRGQDEQSEEVGSR